MARPTKPDEERRSEVLQLRLTKAERAALQNGAKAAGELLSEFIRTSGLEKAERIAPAKLPRLG